MNDGKDDNIKRNAIKITDEIMNLTTYKAFFADVQKLVASASVSKEDLPNTLQRAMAETGLDIRLRNTVFYWINNKTQPETHSKASDPLSLLSKASAQWEKRIHKSLNSMAVDLDTALAQEREQAEKEELSDKWNELSTFSLDLSKYRPVYAPKDFLEVLLSLSGFSPPNKENEPKWEFAHLPLRVKNLSELRQLYAEWSRGDCLYGVNSQSPSALPGYATLEAERLSLGERVAELGYAPVAQEFLKKGCPQCLRARLWAQVLGAEVTAVQQAKFVRLQKQVLDVDLMIDKLIFKDVQLTASNDDQYFVFEDLLYQVMLCFSRDSSVHSSLSGVTGSPLVTTIKGRPTGPDSTTAFPPSGIIPFHGFTMYATPFCYLYDDPAQLYYTFRAFYLRYWHRLHNISTHPQGIVSLCLLYERLLEANEPLLWIHFRNININPIRVVFKWLMRAFSGHLPPDQLLLLWDAVLGYDSLELLSLLAIAILSFRKENIFQVNTLQNVDAVLADLSTISVVPLLQLALMKT